jgi:hypothetical protein
VRLTPGPDEEQTIVRYCFDQYARGLATIGQLTRELVVRWPGRRWSIGVVNALLKNPAYAGDVVWCRRQYNAADREQKNRVRAQDHWVVVSDAHPALVTRTRLRRGAAPARREQTQHIRGRGLVSAVRPHSLRRV